MPKMLLDDALSKGLDTTSGPMSESMNLVVFGELGFNFLASASMNQLMSSIASIQIMVFSGMMNLDLPANVQFFQNQIVGILNADVIDPSWST